MRYILIFYVLIFISKINAQQEKNIIYLKYDKSMIVNEYYDTLKNLHIELKFTISSKDIDAKPTTYNYIIDNISLDGDLKFEDIKDKISKEESKKIRLTSLNDLRELKTCNLFLLLADSRIFLINNNNSSIMLLSTNGNTSSCRKNKYLTPSSLHFCNVLNIV